MCNNTLIKTSLLLKTTENHNLFKVNSQVQFRQNNKGCSLLKINIYITLLTQLFSVTEHITISTT